MSREPSRGAPPAAVERWASCLLGTWNLESTTSYRRACAQIQTETSCLILRLSSNFEKVLGFQSPTSPTSGFRSALLACMDRPLWSPLVVRSGGSPSDSTSWPRHQLSFSDNICSLGSGVHGRSRNATSELIFTLQMTSEQQDSGR
jgi:hypothetical protein